MFENSKLYHMEIRSEQNNTAQEAEVCSPCTATSRIHLLLHCLKICPPGEAIFGLFVNLGFLCAHIAGKHIFIHINRAAARVPINRSYRPRHAIDQSVCECVCVYSLPSVWWSGLINDPD